MWSEALSSIPGIEQVLDTFVFCCYILNWTMMGWYLLCSLVCVCMRVCMLSHFSHVWQFVISGTVAHQAPLSMDFSRHEYWSGMPFPTPGDLPNPGTEPLSITSPSLAGGFFTASRHLGSHQGTLSVTKKYIYVNKILEESFTSK